MKNILLIFCIASAAIVQAQTKSKVKTPVSKVKVKTDAPVAKVAIDSFSYAIGLNIAGNLRSQGIDNIDYASLQRAMNDVFNNKTLLLTEAQSRMSIQEKLAKFMANKSSAAKEEGKRFLAENKKRPGVVELPNGLQYEIIKQGTGEKPKATDTVKAHYSGKLINGQEFDNSYSRGEPLQIAVNRVIPGWTQALQMMPVGSKWKLFIPSDLGYGDAGAGGAIPGGATLIFEVELLDIVHNNQK